MPVMEMTLDEQTAQTAVLYLHGCLDLLSAMRVRERLAAAVKGGHRRLVVDLVAVPFIDSTGLGSLISGLKTARQAGGDLRLSRPGDQARVVLQLTALDRVLRPYPTVEEALSGY